MAEEYKVVQVDMRNGGLVEVEGILNGEQDDGWEYRDAIPDRERHHWGIILYRKTDPGPPS
ncbi:MAG: hypothetical protein ACW99U_19625 [Candidatus Thorarchaeota archaeon]|jgi:hypothetical protein